MIDPYFTSSFKPGPKREFTPEMDVKWAELLTKPMAEQCKIMDGLRARIRAGERLPTEEFSLLHRHHIRCQNKTYRRRTWLQERARNINRNNPTKTYHGYNTT